MATERLGRLRRQKLEVVVPAAQGEKYRPANLLVQYVKAGRLGRKVGRGVYRYPDR